uniref:SRCR domain-containing protein n=1 Tax=Xiphophorus maculatus TaxID=8083 RepID=A0A3B5Q1W1_XIPMA
PGHQSVRLEGAKDQCAGRVEVWKDRMWGTVCDDRFDLREANVVCAQLGCGTALKVTGQNGLFPPGSGPIHLDELNCTGNEQNLWFCPGVQENSDCGHKEDAGMRCLKSSPLSVSGHEDQCAGRVEVWKDGKWGTVCDDRWDLNNGDVVCDQLDCGIALRVTGQNGLFPPGSGPIHLDELNCTGNEQNLWFCPGVQENSDSKLTAPSPLCSVRLEGAKDQCAGRVEVWKDRMWGTVCDDRFDLREANVVCAQLGCGTALKVTGQNGLFPPGSGPIHLDELNCTGNEQNLWFCPGVQENSDCGHKEDAGVVCSGQSDGSVRLEGAKDQCAGRVEVWKDRMWGTVCDDRFDLREANVVCAQLGCGTALKVTGQNGLFPPGSGPIHLDELNCTGNEQNLWFCPGVQENSDCGHKEDAGVVCSGEPEPGESRSRPAAGRR